MTFFEGANNRSNTLKTYGIISNQEYSAICLNDKGGYP